MKAIVKLKRVRRVEDSVFVLVDDVANESEAIIAATKHAKKNELKWHSRELKSPQSTGKKKSGPRLFGTVYTKDDLDKLPESLQKVFEDELVPVGE